MGAKINVSKSLFRSDATCFFEGILVPSFSYFYQWINITVILVDFPSSPKGPATGISAVHPRREIPQHMRCKKIAREHFPTCWKFCFLIMEYLSSSFSDFQMDLA